MKTSMQDPDTELLPADFENIDHILDIAERVMLSVSSKLKIGETRIERWRWDVPEIRASWGPPSWKDINRNVIFHVLKDGDASYHGVVDINAWKDEAFAGIATRRAWKNDSFPPVPLTQEPGLLPEAIQTGFVTVLQWREEQLERSHLIPRTT
jgi:hypothetical protein